jgi:hypothetical protein
MSLRPSICRTASRRTAAVPYMVLSCLLASLAFVATPAGAVDGCKVLLCLAAPSWRSIEQCVPTIHELFRDLAKGKVFPTCAMAGPGNSASHAWASAPGNCPPQYVSEIDGVFSCAYAGVVSVFVDGTPFSSTWWQMDGETVTDFSTDAKARLGQWDTQFDRDYADWLQAQEAARESFFVGRSVPWTRLPSSH